MEIISPEAERDSDNINTGHLKEVYQGNGNNSVPMPSPIQMPKPIPITYSGSEYKVCMKSTIGFIFKFSLESWNDWMQLWKK